MEYQDYYKIMGLERDATQDEVRRAYRVLARKYHPDVSTADDAEARFKEVGEAYAVLKDPEKRSAYDQLGENWQSGQNFTPPPNWDAGFEFSGAGFADGGASSDFFDTLFGQGFGQAGARGESAPFNMRGEDHHAKIVIELEDAYRGATRSITLQRPQVDENGRLTKRQHTLSVKIPKGVKPGQRIRLSEQGAPGISGGVPGDLYLEIGISPHKLFTIETSDVYLKLPLTPWEAALGAVVRVPTPDGPIQLTVPAGTSSGQKLRMSGRGLPGNPPGDFFAIAQITVPAADSKEAKELYEKMADELAYDPRANLRG